MSTIQEIEDAIQKLPAADLAALRAWFAESDAEVWDRQFERDIAAEPISAPVHLPFPAYAEIASRALPAAALAPAKTPPGQRPFLGYDRERVAYARLQPGLLKTAEGKYVVLVGEDLEGPVDTFED